MWTIPGGTKKSERLWNNIIQTNLNYSAIFFCNSRAKSKGRTTDAICWTLQGLWHSPYHILLSILQRQRFDGCTVWWMRIVCTVASREESSRAQCPSWDWWQVVTCSTASLVRLLSYFKWACAQMLPQNIDSIQKVMKCKNVTKTLLDSSLHLPPTILILKPHRHITVVKFFSN